MELVKPDINVDFIRWRYRALIVSLLLILIGLGSLVVRGGPNYGVDFAGGVVIQLRFDKPTGAEQIRTGLKDMALDSLVVQKFGEEGHEFLLRTPQSSSELQSLGQQVVTQLQKSYTDNDVTLRRVEMVGPQVGQDLRRKGALAIVYALIGILIYVTWRFELRFAVGAITALVHDVLITLGAFSLTGKEINLPIIAAFLAIIGYSLNDTIIVYDRIREKMGPMHDQGLAATVNRGINETLSRTLLTSGTTLLVVLALFVFGGAVIHDFAFALLIGVLVGTFSSIFVASPMLLYWQKWQSKPAQPQSSS